VNFKVAITEMYPRIPWVLLAEPLVSSEHTLGTPALEEHYEIKISLNIHAMIFKIWLFNVIGKVCNADRSTGTILPLDCFITTAAI
jgi:hypothetical protein